MGRLRANAARLDLRVTGVALLFALSLPLLDYTNQDVTTTYIHAIWLVLAAHALVCLLWLAIFTFALHTRWGRLLAAMLAVFITMQHFPSTRLGTAPAAFLGASAILLVIWGAVAGLEFLARRRPDHRPHLTFLTFIACTIFGINLLLGLTYAEMHWRALAYTPQSPVTRAKLAHSSNRDIYYIVLDRYSSQSNLTQNFGYDNSAFLNTLHGLGFVTRDDAHSNYQYTAPSIASTMRLGYHTDLEHALAGAMPVNWMPYETIIHNAPISQILKRAGYTNVNVGNWWDGTRTGYQSNNILPGYQLSLFGHHWNLAQTQSLAFGRSFLQPLLGITNYDPRTLYLSQSAQLRRLAEHPAARPRFIFAHLLMPHPPYVFDAHGGKPAYDTSDTDTGISRSQKYLSQLQFGNQDVTALIKDIQAHAKTPPVIIIQADEGPYPLGNLPDWTAASPATLNLKSGTLAAYDLPGATADQTDQIGSNVNVFRFVLDHYFGANLPMLPDCTFFYNDARPFEYKDVSAKLHPADPSCKRLGELGLAPN